MFRVSLLRKCIGEVQDATTATVEDNDLSSSLPQPERILDERVIIKGKYRPRTEILFKWVDRAREDAKWETKWRFAKAYPDFHLEDKVSLSRVDCYVPKSMHVGLF